MGKFCSGKSSQRRGSRETGIKEDFQLVVLSDEAGRKVDAARNSLKRAES